MEDMIARIKSDILKAIAHPTRLKIIELLRHGEKCVCEIIPALGLEQANVSQHLAVLRDRGIVEYRRQGASVFYRVRNKEIYKMLDYLDEIVLENLEYTKDIMSFRHK